MAAAAAVDWDAMRQEGALARWRTLCATDAVLKRHLPGATARFAVEQEGVRLVLGFADGSATISEGGDAAAADTAFSAPAGTWAKFLERAPPRHHHNLFALRMRVPEFQATGDELAWAQHCLPLRRALDLGRWVLRGENGPAPASLRPSLGTPAPRPPARGRYVTVRAAGREFVLYGETAGEGRRPILGLHTAGADGRQFHRLMAEGRLADAGWSVTSFDMPGHGRSPAVAEPGAWALNTYLYAELILGFLKAWDFAEKPVLLGASMSGEIALEMALRAPERFAGIVACEAADHIPGRRTPFATHPRVNSAVFTPEWVEGLMAPQSPAECAAEVWWHYSQGGAGTFPGDILFYSGGWDARERIHRIDTARCPLWMLTGEYDFSCTAELSAETAARIPGARFGRMDGMGHFPFAENPALFLDHLLPALESFSA